MKVFKNFSIYSIGSMLQSAISLFLLPIYLSYFSPAEYGIITVLIVLGSTLALVTNFGSNSGFYRLYFEKDRPRLFSTVIAWRIIISCVVFIVLLIYLKPLTMFFLKSDAYVYPMFLQGIFLLLSPVKELFFLTLRLEQKAKKFLLYSLSYMLIDFALKIIYIVFLKRGVTGYFVAQILVEIVIIVVILMSERLIRMLRIPKFSLIKEVLKVGFPYTFSDIGDWIMQSADKLLLNHFLGPSVVGVYNLAIKLSSLFQIVLVKPMNLWWGPHILQRASVEGMTAFKSETKKFFHHLILPSALLSAIIGLGSPIIMLISRNPEYRQAIQLVPFAIIPSFLSLLLLPFAVQFIQAKRTRYAGYGGMISAMVSIGMNFLFIPILGIWGAVLANIGAYTVWLVIYAYGGQKSIPIQYEIRRSKKPFLLFLAYETILLFSVLYFENYFIHALVATSLVMIAVLVSTNYSLLKSIIKDVTFRSSCINNMH